MKTLWVLEVREQFSIQELTSACSASYFREMGLLGLGMHFQLLLRVRDRCHRSPVLALCVCPGLQLNPSSEGSFWAFCSSLEVFSGFTVALQGL